MRAVGSGARRIIVVAAEDSLGFRAGEPLDESCCGIFVGRIFQCGGVIDQRLRLVGFAVHSQADFRMIGMDVLSAQIDFRRQRDIRQIERAGLDLVRRRCVQFAALQSRHHRGLSKDLLRVDGGAKNLCRNAGKAQEFFSQHQGENNVAALRISDRIGATKAQAGLQQNLPQIFFALRQRRQSGEANRLLGL